MIVEDAHPQNSDTNDNDGISYASSKLQEWTKTKLQEWTKAKLHKWGREIAMAIQT